MDWLIFVKRDGPYLALYMGAAWLIFKNLGDQTLRLDEARTALLARHILKRGLPAVDDGDRPPCFTAVEYNRDGLSVLHTWLQYYLAALSFRLFGQSAATARLSFALFGLLAIGMAQRLAADIAAGALVPFITAVLLATSVSFLLMVRQARYYALAFFFQAATLWAFLHSLSAPGTGSLFLLAICGLLLYYSDWALWVTTVSATAVYYLLLDFSWATAPLLAAALLVMLAGIAPWQLYLKRAHYRPLPRGFLPSRDRLRWLKTFRRVFPIYFWKAHVYFFPIVTLLPFVWLLNRLLGQDNMNWLPGKSAWLLVLVILADLASHSFTGGIFTRYIAGTLIPAAILCAGWLSETIQTHLLAGLALLGILVLTNVLHLLPYWVVRYLNIPLTYVPFLASPQVQFMRGASLPAFLRLKARPRSYFLEFLYEISHHYETRTEGLVTFLAAHAQFGDVILLDRMEAPPLAFHLAAAGRPDLVVVPFAEALHPAWPARQPAAANWIVAGGLFPVSPLLTADYQALTMAAIDLYLDNTETLDRHHFRTVERLRGVTLYRQPDPVTAHAAQRAKEGVRLERQEVV